MKRKPKQLTLKVDGRGGKRRGAGRPQTTGNHHYERPDFSERHPLHVTIKLKEGKPSLRRKEVFKQFKVAVKQARSKGMKVVHYSILSNHVHLIMEAAGKRALERAMKSFGISFARRMKKLGAADIFRHRYHLHVLKTPTEVKRALRYVLLNDERHRGVSLSPAKELRENLFQSGFAFLHWGILMGRELRAARSGIIPEDIGELRALLVQPSSWLLREGWKRAI